MGAIDHTELRAPNASKLWIPQQQLDAHGLMPYEMAEIEECSNSLEQALRNGQDINMVALCSWYPLHIDTELN